MLKTFDKKNIYSFFKYDGFLISIFMLASMYTLRATLLSDISIVKTILLLMRFLSYGLVAIKFFIDFFEKKYRKFELFIFIISLYLIYISKQSKTVNYLIYFIYVVVGKDVDYIKIIKTAFFAISICSVFIILLSYIGVLQDKIFNQGTRSRHSLGFVYSPFLSTYCFYLTLYYIYIRKQKIDILEILMLFAINVYIYVLTETRNAFIFAMIAIIITFIVNNVKYFKSFNLFYKVLLIMLPIFLPVASIFTSLSYNPNINLFYKLNSLMSGRIALSKNAIENYGIKLFGQYVEFSNYWNYKRISHNIIDSSYILYLVILGLAFFILMIVLLSYFSKLIIDNKDVYMFYIFTIILLHSVFDAQLFQMSYNYFMFIWSYKNTINKFNYLESQCFI